MPLRTDIRDAIHSEETKTQQPRGPCQPPPIRHASFSGSNVRVPGPFWIRRRPDERNEVDVLRKRKHGSFSEVRDIIHGSGGRDPVHKRPSQACCRRRVTSGTRLPGPCCLNQKPDERKEVDVLRKRKFESYPDVRNLVLAEGGNGIENRRRHPLDLPARNRPHSTSHIPGPFERMDERKDTDFERRRKYEAFPEVKDVAHGEEARGRGETRQMNPYDLPPGPSHAGPFWIGERQDERRDPEIDRRRKYGRQRTEAAEVIHGEDFRDQWERPRGGPEAGGHRPEDDDEITSDEDFEPTAVRKACKCPPGLPESGPDTWRLKKDWGVAWEKTDPAIPVQMKKLIKEPPAARVSCPPEAESAKYDQPNTFMRKLYERYPYLYQILKETPPEELASRVFKDRFLSTYQVDYLHMGVGKESLSVAGPRMEEKYTGPDGEPEPAMVPGCSFRFSKNNEPGFGRKKFEMKGFGGKERDDGAFGFSDSDKKNKDKADDGTQDDKDEPRISEYMATISKLGGEIITDQLYKVAQITKKMKNQYNK